MHELAQGMQHLMLPCLRRYLIPEFTALAREEILRRKGGALPTRRGFIHGQGDAGLERRDGGADIHGANSPACVRGVRGGEPIDRGCLFGWESGRVIRARRR
jgi:hypothetical protein